MTREEHLEFCKVCVNRSFNPKFGITCNLTGQVADFEGTCVNYIPDEKEIENDKKWKESISENTAKSLNKGRVALFVIGGFYFIILFLSILSFINVATSSAMVNMVINGALGIGFLGLAFWSYRRPFLALVLGLTLFITLNLLVALINPTTIMSGLIWKLLIIVWLAYGVSAAPKKNNNKILAQNRSDILDN